jgi:hypothetical protein
MRKRSAFLSAASGIAMAGIVVLSRSDGVVHAAPGAAEAVSPRHRPTDVPVVVELFTSEGCSSCPPADDLLARLEQTQPVEGALVVPLAFHVDYWDELGWPDPFASPSFTARQNTYAIPGGRVYTPQAVVDGQTELVGSRANALEQAIQKAALRPHATIGIAVQQRGGSFEVAVHVGPLPKVANTATGTRATVVVALTDAETRVHVLRGENGGKTLRHTAVVRVIESAGTVDAQGGDVHAALRVPAGVPEATLRVVAMVQRGREIVGSATKPVAH